MHPELRDRAVQILTDALARPSENDPGVNADFVHELVKLKAVEALPIMRQAFEQDLVDETVMGGWGEVLKELGQEVDSSDPLVQQSQERWEARQAAFRASFAASARQQHATSAAPEKRKQSTAKKKKNKRKQSAASRKANKRKRK